MYFDSYQASPKPGSLRCQAGQASARRKRPLTTGRRDLDISVLVILSSVQVLSRPLMLVMRLGEPCPQS